MKRLILSWCILVHSIGSYAILYPGDNAPAAGVDSAGSWYADVMKKTAAGIKIVKPDKVLLANFNIRPSEDFSLNYGSDEHVDVFRFGVDND